MEGSEGGELETGGGGGGVIGEVILRVKVRHGLSDVSKEKFAVLKEDPQSSSASLAADGFREKNVTGRECPGRE